MLPLTLAHARELLHARELSVEELTSEFLIRAQRLNPQFNAFIHLDADGVLEQGRALDRLPSEQQSGSLFGIPLAVKDNIDVAGQPTTCGARGFDTQPTEHARVVSRLYDEQALIIGKNNLHEFAWGGTTANRTYGAVTNPWDTTRICHGSSGGSAAAVGAGMCFGALGTDTGTSIRQPSAVTGLTGLRPTLGFDSTHGNLSPCTHDGHGGTHGAQRSRLCSHL